MPINAKPHSRRLFRLRTILLVVMLSVLLLPIASVYLFRFYENELVRRTEEQLIDQSAALAAIYRELRRAPGVAIAHSQPQYNQDFYIPITPTLELSLQRVLPRRDVARNTQQAITATDWQVGLRMQNILLNTQRYTLAGMRVLDANGIVIAGRSEVGESLSHVLEVRNALAGNYRAVIRERISDEPPPPLASISRGTGIRVFTAFPVIEQGEV
ncbi:MAG: sensor histidine kinase, partial [Thiothrix litoralis]